MVRRILTALLLLAILLPAVYYGGIPYFVLVAAFVGIATLEYDGMFRRRGFEPSRSLALASVVVILATRAFLPEAATTVFALAILAAMSVHLYMFERGRDEAPLDLTVTLGAIAYLGWIAGYLLDLRKLPNGMWWLLLVLVIVWVADSTAYFIGVRFGRHKMSVRLSPKKSWEGYLSGVVVGTLAAGILALLMAQLGRMEVNLGLTLSLGFILSTLTTLGDLGESLFKRFAGVKDSGAFLPGHGGAFDRIDSLIWAGVLGYLWIKFIVL